jgi:hypothetical protein
MVRLLNLLILLMFAARSVLPAGVMLAAGPGQAAPVQIVICTGHGLQTLVLDEQGVPRPSTPSAGDKTTCPFAPIGAVTTADDAPRPLALTVRYAAITFAITAELFREVPKAGPNSARGPPIFLT